MPGITELLIGWNQGDESALDRLMPLVYDELRRVARRRLAMEGREHTFQSAALVNETYLRLVDQKRVEWRSRMHFFAISARMMRRILVDHARHRNADKRGGANRRLHSIYRQASRRKGISISLRSTRHCRSYPSSIRSRLVSLNCDSSAA